jgi:hypothetical protein
VKFVVLLCTQTSIKFFLIATKIQPDIITNILMPLILTNFAFYGQCLLTVLNTKFHEHQFSGSRVIPCGQTDKRDEYQSGLPQLLKETQCKG